MPNSESKSVEDVLLATLTDSLNRTLRALEDAGAIDTREFRHHYRGDGSKYYDLVTELLQQHVRSGAVAVRDALSQFVTISLTRDEVLVLQALLDRLANHENLGLEHQAEQRALWDLAAQMEARTDAIFAPNYSDQLREARERLADDGND